MATNCVPQKGKAALNYNWSKEILISFWYNFLLDWRYISVIWTMKNFIMVEIWSFFLLVSLRYVSSSWIHISNLFLPAEEPIFINLDIEAFFWQVFTNTNIDIGDFWREWMQENHIENYLIVYWCIGSSNRREDL